MKKFTYEARDKKTGKITKAAIQANSETSAAKLLIDQGFTPINIKETVDNDGFFAKLTGRITTKDKVIFTRQLAILIGAGLPIAESLHTALEQSTNKRLQSIILDVTVSIESGKSLSDSFSKHPEVFDPVFLALVGAGEASGTLDQALLRVANQQEKDAAIISKLKGAMTYPIIVLFVIIVVIIFMLVTVVPQVVSLYKDLKQSLPILTQLLVAASNFFVNFWWLIFIVTGFVVYFSVQYVKTDAGSDKLDSLKLKVPIFGKMYNKLYMARLMRTGQTLLVTGVSMLDMLSLTALSVNNSLIKNSIMRAAEKVKGGKTLSDSLKPEQYIMSLVPQMIKIGERSGKIDEMMGKTAQVFEDELDEEVRTISTSIEPILMVVLAIVAGGMVAAILLPIYSLVNKMTI